MHNLRRGESWELSERVTNPLEAVTRLIQVLTLLAVTCMPSSSKALESWELSERVHNLLEAVTRPDSGAALLPGPSNPMPLVKERDALNAAEHCNDPAALKEVSQRGTEQRSKASCACLLACSRVTAREQLLAHALHTNAPTRNALRHTLCVHRRMCM